MRLLKLSIIALVAVCVATHSVHCMKRTRACADLFEASDDQVVHEEPREPDLSIDLTLHPIHYMTPHVDCFAHRGTGLRLRRPARQKRLSGNQTKLTTQQATLGLLAKQIDQLPARVVLQIPSVMRLNTPAGRAALDEVQRQQNQLWELLRQTPQPTRAETIRAQIIAYLPPKEKGHRREVRGQPVSVLSHRIGDLKRSTSADLRLLQKHKPKPGTALPEVITPRLFATRITVTPYVRDLVRACDLAAKIGGFLFAIDVDGVLLQQMSGLTPRQFLGSITGLKLREAFYAAPKDTVDDMITWLVSYLISQGHMVIFLTACAYERAPLRVRDIRRCGIPLDLTGESQFESGAWACDGIVYCGKLDKGHVLLEVLRRCRGAINRVVGIDDELQNLESMQGACNGAGIEFWPIQFTKQVAAREEIEHVMGAERFQEACEAQQRLFEEHEHIVPIELIPSAIRFEQELEATPAGTIYDGLRAARRDRLMNLIRYGEVDSPDQIPITLGRLRTASSPIDDEAPAPDQIQED